MCTLEDEAPELRPLYFDTQATTPLVSFHVTVHCHVLKWFSLLSQLAVFLKNPWPAQEANECMVRPCQGTGKMGLLYLGFVPLGKQ